MYVIQSRACDLPNSSTPMTAERIRAQDLRMAAAARHFTGGNQTLDDLVEQLGGNPVSALYGDAGVPTLGGAPFSPGSGLNRGGPGSPGFGPGAPGDGGGPCIYPEVLPLVTVFPIPVFQTPTPVTPLPPYVQPSPFGRPSTPPPVPAMRPRDIDCDNVTAENICRLSREGCFVPGQLSQQQLYACSWAGWVGNWDMHPSVIVAGGAQNGRKFGTMNPQPVDPHGNPVAPSPYGPPPESYPGIPGLSGVGADAGGPLIGPGSSVIWGSLGLMAFSLWAVGQFSGKARR
jgi:hypothetical protein